MKNWKKILSIAFIICCLAIGALAQEGAPQDDAPKKPKERPEVPVKPKKDEPPRDKPKDDDRKKPPRK